MLNVKKAEEKHKTAIWCAQQKNYGEAFVHLHEAIALDPELIARHNAILAKRKAEQEHEIALVNYKEKKYEETIYRCNKAIWFYPDFAAAHELLHKAYCDKGCDKGGEYKKALWHLGMATNR